MNGGTSWCWRGIHTSFQLCCPTKSNKTYVCNYVCAYGDAVIPSGEDVIHLIQGHPKPIPTTTFIILECDATEMGYPENEWDLSVSRRTPFLYLTKAISPYPPNITINQFPILTPLTPNPVQSLGGNVAKMLCILCVMSICPMLKILYIYIGNIICIIKRDTT